MSIDIKEAQSLLKVAGSSLRTAKERIAYLEEKNASYEKEKRVIKLAQEMEAKGLNEELTFEQKVAHLNRVQNLDVTEEAVKMASVQGNFMGQTSDVPGSGSAEQAFITFINEGVDVRD